VKEEVSEIAAGNRMTIMKVNIMDVPVEYQG
jgi:hypothetical protein